MVVAPGHVLEVIPCVGVGLGKKLFGHLFWQRKLGKENQEENPTPENTDYFTRVTLALPAQKKIQPARSFDYK